MNHIPIGYGITLSIWWSWMWRAILFAVLAGAVAGAVAGFILGIAGVSIEVIRLVSGTLGLFIGLAVSIWALKTALSKKHKGYSLQLVE